MKQPVIGIALALRAEDHDLVPLPAYRFEYLKQHYYEAIEDHGGLPIGLPASERENHIDEYCELIDGLLLVGGEDINPAEYGEEVDKLTQIFMPRRDKFELRMIRAALKRNIPILGICRGMQILNVACGGTLYQDLSYRTQAHNHSQVGQLDFATSHFVTALPDTLLRKLVERDRFETNTAHHQGVKKLGDGLVVSAISEDGEIEAIEGRGFTLGVQWHPESWGADTVSRKIFSGFTANSREFRAGRKL